MIIKIKGSEGEGKTTIARNIVGKNSCVVIGENGLKNKLWYDYLNNYTDFLIIDDVEDADITEANLPKGDISFRPPFKQKAVTVKLPKIIIIIEASKA